MRDYTGTDGVWSECLVSVPQIGSRSSLNLSDVQGDLAAILFAFGVRTTEK